MKNGAITKVNAPFFVFIQYGLFRMVTLEQNTEKRFDKITNLLRETIHDRNLNLSAINSKTPRL